MNRGIRAETASDILTELHSLEYFEEMIDREYRLAAGETRGTLKKGSLISAFNDRKFYNGAVPTGKYIQNMFIDFSLSIQTFLEAEMKKWAAC